MLKRSFGSYIVFLKNKVIKIFEPRTIVKYINLLFTGKPKNLYNSRIGALYAMYKKNLIREFLKELSRKFNVEIVVPRVVGTVRYKESYGIIMEKIEPEGIRINLEGTLKKIYKAIVREIERAGIPIWQYSFLRSLFGKEVEVYCKDGKYYFYFYDWESGVVHPSRTNPIIGFDFIDFEKLENYIESNGIIIDEDLLKRTKYLQDLFKKTVKVIFCFK